MKAPFEVNEAVVALVNVEARLVGEPEQRLVPAGSIGTVVFLHSNGGSIAGCEVEFPIGSKGWGHATVVPEEIESHSLGRVYQAIVTEGSLGGVGRHVAAVACSVEEAHRLLEQRYGAGSVFNLHNEADAQH